MSARCKCLWVPIASLLFVTFIGFSQDTEKDRKKDDDDQVYDLEKGMTPPRLIHQVYPAYNPGSRGVRIVGKVVIRLIVTSKGFPKDPSIVQGLADEVDQSALAAVKEWRFDPAQRDGMPVAVRIVVEINFRAM
jgi:TonB family protein